MTLISLEGKSTIDKSPRVVNGVRIDTMLELPEGTVFDPIPEGERRKYLTRGASIGVFALNLMIGKNRVNPYDDLYMHVDQSGGHDIALSNAQLASRTGNIGSLVNQFGSDAVEQWRQLTGSVPDHFPGIVFGIPRDYESRLVLHPQTIYPVVGEVVPFSHIDPYSQELLGNLFDIDLSRH